jgi:hypothetical protein
MTVALSVVIASHNAETVIAACLGALETQAAGLDVIVADSSTDATPAIVRSAFPWVQLLHVDEPWALPALRGAAIARARGALVAILDPYSIAAADWAEQVIRAHASRPNAVIGGSVDLAGADSCSWSAWATYLHEYGLFMPPIARGETWIVPGSNVSYKRAALFDGARPRYPVFWKTFVNWEIERGGSPLWLDPNVRVALNKPIPFGDFLSTRFAHGRCFGGMRVQDAPAHLKAWRAASTVLVPVVQLWRWTRGFWSKRRRRTRFLMTLPAQAVLFSMWACGEALGYVRGSGRSCDRLYY